MIGHQILSKLRSLPDSDILIGLILLQVTVKNRVTVQFVFPTWYSSFVAV